VISLKEMLNNLFEKVFQNKNFCYLSLIIFFALLSFFYSNIIDQRAITDSLIISDKIYYEDKFNPFYLSQKNGYSALIFSLKFLIEFGISTKFLNFAILFFSLLFNAFGIYLISKSICKNNFFSLITSVIILTFQINFGDLDYPTMVISEHTNSMLSSAIVVFIFGLISNQKISTALIISIFLISFHVLIGLWLTSILIFSIIFFQNEKIYSFFNSKKDIIFLTIALIFLFLSFFYFQQSKILNPYTYDQKSFDVYMEMWELHRSNFFKINYNYIILTFFLVIILYFMRNEKKLVFFINTLFLSIFLSFIIYITYKLTIYEFLPNFLTDIFLKVIPSRFFLLHSVIGPAVILSAFFYVINKFLHNNNIILLILLLIVSHPVLFYEKYLNKVTSFHSSWNNPEPDNNFWNNIKNDNLKGKLILTSVNSCKKTILIARKPILICVESLDMIPYQPKLVAPIKEIIEEVYDINFDNPVEKNHGGLWYDVSYKEQFENRNVNEWHLLSKKYNLGALVLPKNWNINLDKTFVGAKYAYYKF